MIDTFIYTVPTNNMTKVFMMQQIMCESANGCTFALLQRLSIMKSDASKILIVSDDDPLYHDSAKLEGLFFR